MPNEVEHLLASRTQIKDLCLTVTLNVAYPSYLQHLFVKLWWEERLLDVLQLSSDIAFIFPKCP
jgi:hypothetical protein